MKKLFGFALLAIMLTLVAGEKNDNVAGAGKAKVDSPKVVVEKFFVAMGNLDKAGAKSQCLESSKIMAQMYNSIDNMKNAPKEVQQKITANFKNAKVFDEKIDGDKAIVEFKMGNQKVPFILVKIEGKWKISGPSEEVLAAAREKALAISCLTHLKILGQAIRMYEDENKDTIPMANSDWKKLINEYAQDEKAFICPKNQAPYRYLGNGQADSSLQDPSREFVFVCECEHGGKLNVCFADGHVASHPVQAVKDAIKNAKPGKLPLLK
ncbi:MAG: DUF4878 domain-containing protein [Victivallales bacterium]|nr:DUF4878 domain-containing protein [Victivallales bacterium]